MTLNALAPTLDIFRRSVAELTAHRDQFTTVDLIRQVNGEYHNARQTSVAASENAWIGRMLSYNAEHLQIKLVQRGVKSQDDEGHRTTTALWCTLQSSRGSRIHSESN